jgi:hypothetical protein
MAGTAAQVDCWVLLEYRPVWRAKAHGDNDLSAPVRDWLDGTLVSLAEAGFKPRLQFIRQPELDGTETRLLLGVDGRLLEFAGVGYDFLLNLDLVDAAQHPERHRPLEEPRYFVCTNGQRDVCCARFGLKSYAALRAAVGERVWQVTHLGGHRFAPNVLVLPQGLLYGRVTEDSVEAFVHAVESGELAQRWLRGRSRYPAPVQAAEAALGRSDLKLLHVDGDAASSTVTFATPTDSLKVTVQRGAEPMPVMKSCGAELEPVFPYEVL